MPGGEGMAWGLRSLADGFFRYYQPSTVCYLRKQNILNSPGDYSSLGFQVTVTGNQLSGITDIQIDPPADVQDVSMHNIGVLGGRLNFGARIFLISHTFVQAQIDLNNYTEARQVWRDKSVIGLFYNKRLYSIESITTETVGSSTTLWKLICNTQEEPVALTE